MIGTIDIKVNAAHPNLPLSPFYALVNSPSSVRVINVPRRIGAWEITKVYLTANYPDNASRSVECVNVAGCWVATVPACATVGKSANGFQVIADGVDERGNAVQGYALGVGDLFILSRAGNIVIGETSWYFNFRDSLPAHPLKGDACVIDGELKWFNGSAWVPFGGSGIDLSDVTLDLGGSQESINEVLGEVVRRAGGTVIAALAVWLSAFGAHEYPTNPAPETFDFFGRLTRDSLVVTNPPVSAAELAAATNSLRGKLDMTVYQRGWAWDSVNPTVDAIMAKVKPRYIPEDETWFFNDVIGPTGWEIVSVQGDGSETELASTLTNLQTLEYWGVRATLTGPAEPTADRLATTAGVVRVVGGLSAESIRYYQSDPFDRETIYDKIVSTRGDLASHIGDTANPHQVTASQIGAVKTNSIGFVNEWIGFYGGMYVTEKAAIFESDIKRKQGPGDGDPVVYGISTNGADYAHANVNLAPWGAWLVSPQNPDFTNAVLSVQISTNDFASLYELKQAFADLPIDPVTGGVSLGALLAALASAVAWLKKNKVGKYELVATAETIKAADRTVTKVTLGATAVEVTFPDAESGKTRDFLLRLDAANLATGGSLTITKPTGATIYGDAFPSPAAGKQYLVAITETAANEFYVRLLEITEPTEG